MRERRTGLCKSPAERNGGAGQSLAGAGLPRSQVECLERSTVHCRCFAASAETERRPVFHERTVKNLRTGWRVLRYMCRIPTSLTALQLFSSQSEMRSGEIVLKSFSFLHGSKLDVIQPNLARDKIVELLARQADKPNHDQFGLWPGREIQKQRRPSVASAGQIVS